MKRTKRCPKCDGQSLLFLREVADATGGFGGFTAWRLVQSADGRSACGYVQALVCRGCGFTELYVYDPESIPVDGDRVVAFGATPRSPFR